MRSSREKVTRRAIRAATVLILGTVAALGLAWSAPRASEAVGTWVAAAPSVETRALAVGQGLAVGQAGPAASSAQRLRSAREAGVVTLDAGKRFTMLGLLCDVPVAGAEVEVRLRTSLDGRAWSAWYAAPLEVAGDRDQAPRAFVDALWTGDGRFVQVCAAAAGDDAPVALSSVELMALDARGGQGVVARAVGTVRHAVATIAGVGLGASPAAAAVETPQWVTRAGWGADESLRSAEPVFAPVKMAFVHHTAGNNTYTRAQAAEVVRGIYVYHTKGLGWSDIGYNFLVDRFGTVYVGRYGGPGKGVVGAHAYGFNTGSTGISIMGTYTTETPSAATVAALSRLLAWKLDRHGLDPLGTASMTCGATQKYPLGQAVTLPVVSGHRDVNFTECPGEALYARLADVRSAAARQIALAGVAPEPYAATLALSAKRVLAGTPVTFKGNVTTAAGAPAVGTVTVQKRLAPDGAWADWRIAKLSSTGAYAVTVSMTTAPRDWQFRARMMGDGGANLTGTSALCDLSVVMPEPWAVSLALSGGRVAAGTSVTFSGAVKSAAGAPASGKVTLQRRRAPDGAWGDWRAATLDASGAYSVSVTMTSAPRTWKFRVRAPGDGAFNVAGTSLAKTLDVLIPQPYAVTLSLSATKVSAGTSVVFKGAVKTATGEPGSGTITVQKRLAPDGAWLDWRTVSTSATGTYKVAVIMTNAPRLWQVRARIPGDGVLNLEGLSPVRELRVTQ